MHCVGFKALLCPEMASVSVLMELWGYLAVLLRFLQGRRTHFAERLWPNRPINLPSLIAIGVPMANIVA